MKINYVIICYKRLDEERIQVRHKCLYKNKPNQVDFDSLEEELATDENFGMVGDYDYEMMLINREENFNLWTMFEIPNELE
jgi:hypothetical protein